MPLLSVSEQNDASPPSCNIIGMKHDTKFPSTTASNSISAAFHQSLKNGHEQEPQSNGVSKRDADTSTKAEDLERIWEWNSVVPTSVEECVCSLIEARVQARPSAPAVHAWDGGLTYGELDDLATRLASRLRLLGVDEDVLVPLCFEKSMWTMVAVLGVIKAGGAFVLLDASVPEHRLQVMVHQLQASVIISSTSSRELSSRLAERIVVLDGNFFAATEPHTIGGTAQQIRTARSSSLLYAVFTSGSTGTPKGVLITNGNAASALYHQAEIMGMNEDARIFDFASYSFDVSVSNMLSALTTGGCLCVPSDDDRKDDLERSIIALEANILDITPSMAQVLSPDRIPSVNTVIFGGEALHPADISRWWGKVNMIHIYGPCECTPTSTINYNMKSADEAVSIGKGVGLVTWIVDPDNHDILVPLGCPGELLLEGPLVGRGYLEDEAKTAAAFIEDPAWLLRGTPTKPGRRGRLYKTGDLAQYKADGRLSFVGRKQAAQVKIRGQRLELGEIEHTLRNHKRVNEAVAALQQEGSQEPRIVSFVTVHGAGTVDMVSGATSMRQKIREELYEMMKSRLPFYMVPQVIEVLDKMPLNRNGKIDRLALIKSLQDRALIREPVRVRQPVSQAQRQMLQIWGRILNLETSTIGIDASFFHLGGSSISAMKVVAESRSIGIYLSVADVFRHPVLHELVEQSHYTESPADTGDHIIAPFALLSEEYPLNTLLPEICARYKLGRFGGTTDTGFIQDAYPCTPLQEGLMSLTSISPGTYIGQKVLRIHPGTSIEKLRGAWEQVVRALPILRTRIVHDDRLGLVQLVVDEPIDWIEAHCLDDHLASDISQPMDLGQPLTRYALIKEDVGAPKWFVWTIHHALYDGWSLPFIIEAVRKAYRGEGVTRGLPFQAFVKYVKSQDNERMRDYWLDALGDCQCAPFPSLPPNVDKPMSNQTVEHSFPSPQSNRLGITSPILIRAAWALLVGKTTGTDDVVFGATLFGRNVPLTGVETITGPTFATVPIRVKWNENDGAVAYLKAVQQQAAGMIAYEQIGLHQLAGFSPETRQACRFQTLLVIQPEDVSDDTDVLGTWRSDLGQGDRYESHGLMLIVQLDADAVKVSASFDSRIIDSWVVEKLLRRWEHVASQLHLASPELLLSDVETMTPEELKQIWDWNHAVPSAADQCVHELFEEVVQAQPQASAVCAWDGEWTYSQLNQVSTDLARYLVSLGVGPESIVPLCFEKSRWMPVAMLAVMKAGGASVALDSTQPEERLRTIVQQTEPSLVLVLSSSLNEQLASRLSDQRVVVVNDGLMASLLKSLPGTYLLPVVTPSNKLYVAFTSGSTGIPKGAVVTHENFSSAVHHLRNSSAGRLGPDARVYDFASYAFDISWFNNLQSLTNGASLCIPSESDRMNDLSGSIHRLRASFAILTPSTANILPLETISSLQTLMLAGEALPAEYARRWAGLTRLKNGYGPCECTPITTVADIDEENVLTPSIGKGVGVNTWVVQTSNHNRLVPIGDIGELVLEGPLVGRGYLGDAEQTATAFIQDPKWLVHGASGHLGRQNRVYKTGDVVRHNSDGSLVFVRRKDASQVKIRGQRVELGDVEHHVHVSIPSARQIAAEVILPADSNGKDRPTLAAFVRFDDRGASSSPAVVEVVSVSVEVNEQLATRLPGYMVPTVYLSLGEFPTNSSGKIDRRRLRELGASFTVQQLSQPRRTSVGDKRAPATEVEETLQEIWSRVLGLDRDKIGCDDSFFRLGGDSITAMQASAAARGFGLNISTADILRSKTISMLAATASSSRHHSLDMSVANANAKLDQGHPFDLSPIQQLYAAMQPHPNQCFDQSFYLRLCEPISFTALSEATETVVMRHPMLRARFFQTDKGAWRQRETEDTCQSFHLCEVTCADSTSSSKTEEIRQCRERLNIETGPILTAVLFHESGRQSLFIAVHHLAIDLVSWRVLLDELEALLMGRELTASPTTSFRTWCSLQEQYAARNLQEEMEKPVSPSQLSYWGLGIDENLQGATVCREFVLDEESSSAILHNCNDAFGTRPVELMIAALASSFSAVFIDRSSPTIFNEGHGREPWDDRIDVSRTIGWFTTIYPAFVPNGTSRDLVDFIRLTKDCIRGLSKNGWSYFTSRFANKGSATANAADFPVEVLFNFAGSYQQLEQSGSLFNILPMSETRHPESWLKLRRFALLEFNAHVDNGRLAVSLEYPKNAQHAGLVEAWVVSYKAALETLGPLLSNRSPEWTLSDFPLSFTSYRDMEEFRSSVIPRLNLRGVQCIEDIFPCTGLQEGFLVAQSKSSDSYRFSLTFEIEATQTHGDRVDQARIERAWQAVVRRHPLLRCLLVDTIPGSSRTMHVVLKDPKPGISSRRCEAGTEASPRECPMYKKNDLQHHLSVHRVGEKRVRICFELNHVILDGHSTNVMIHDFWQAYNGTLSPMAPSYGDFVRYVERRPRDADQRFWLKYLDGVKPCLFPPSKSVTDQSNDITVSVPGLDAVKIHDFCSKWEVTTASVVQTAWAMVLYRFTGCPTPCFGNLTSCRGVPIDKPGDIFGPVISLLPYRVHLDRASTAIETLRESQKQFVLSLPHQTFSPRDMHEAPGIGSPGLFNTIISFQRLSEQPRASTNGHTITEVAANDPMEYPVSLSIGDSEARLSINVTFKRNFISHAGADRVAQAMGAAVSSLISEPHKSINSLLTRQDLDCI
ncbi:nrps [Metarhizium rileyi]|uniref:Nrps n=1 Tax=Metarhizium rileyi (strain RCEF 4871) TaxID=1649241 RepID=A0A5C6G2G9_METRR|nr:nrps [Metarhizium rileyi]